MPTQPSIPPGLVNEYKWVPASTGKAKAGMVHSISGWTRGVQVNCEIPWERVPYPSALEVCSWQDAMQIHVYSLPYHHHHHHHYYYYYSYYHYHNIPQNPTKNCTPNPEQIEQVEIELKYSQLCAESSIVWRSSAGSNFEEYCMTSLCVLPSSVSGTCCLELIPWKITRKHFADSF